MYKHLGALQGGSWSHMTLVLFTLHRIRLNVNTDASLARGSPPRKLEIILIKTGQNKIPAL